MTIVDSTVWIDYLNGEETPHTIWLRLHKLSEEIALTDLVLTEVLQGTSGAQNFTRTAKLLLTFPIFTCTGTAAAIASANNYRLLRSRGITVRKTIDCLIATFCLSRNFALLHHDRDFDHFEREFGLRVVKP